MKIIDDKNKELSGLITEFLGKNPVLARNIIEKELSIPQATLSRAINSESTIPSKHIYNLICFLAPLGFKLYDFSLTVDENGHVFGLKLGDNVKSIEVLKFKDGRTEERDVTNVYEEEQMPEGYTSSSFYYLQEVYKTFWTSYEDL